MSEVLNLKFDEMKSSIFKMIQLAKIYGTEEMQKPKFYKKLTDDFCELKAKAKLSRDTIKKASNCESVEQFDEINNAKKRQSSKAESKVFMDEVTQLLDSTLTQKKSQAHEDDDLVMQEEISDIDPLTKRRIVDPVKNKQCGHVYDKIPIIEALKMNPRLRCPVTGCGSSAIVNAANLVEDVQFRLRLQNANLESN